MSNILLRSTKGSPLSNAEIDTNFSNLNADKIQSGDTVAALTINSATINGGSISGITDLAIEDGGTGASNASAARTNLGLSIGSDVQAYSTHLSSLVNAQKIAGNFVVGNGTTWTVQSGATARNSLGLGALATANTIDNSNWSGAVLAIANGGTGTTTATGTGSVVLASSPALTGDPTAPTQTFGDSSTRLATTAFVQQALQALHPIGSIYTAVIPTNPGTLFGFGTWVAFGAGRVLVGIDAGDTSFNTVEKTGGEKTHTLTINEMPTHTHTQNPHNHTQNPHGHTALRQTNPAASGTQFNSVLGGFVITNTSDNATATNNAVTATNQNTGGGAAHNNLQPYIVVYMWKRTA